MKTGERGAKAGSRATGASLLAGLALALAFAGPMQTVTAQEASRAVPTDLPAEVQEAPDAAAAGEAAVSSKQRRRALMVARREANLERLRNTRQDPARPLRPTQSPPALAEERRSPDSVGMSPQAIVAPVVVPAAAPTVARVDVNVSFKVEPHFAQNSLPDAWLPSCSGAQEGEFTVVARVQARDAQGQPVPIRPEWKPADLVMVSVAPAGGDTVTITVRGAGESNLTVAGQGFSKDLWISAVRQGKAMHVEIFQ